MTVHALNMFLSSFSVEIAGEGVLETIYVLLQSESRARFGDSGCASGLHRSLPVQEDAMEDKH